AGSRPAGRRPWIRRQRCERSRGSSHPSPLLFVDSSPSRYRAEGADPPGFALHTLPAAAPSTMFETLMRGRVLVLLACLMTVAYADAQSPRPSPFRSRSDLVTVYASVTDHSGRLVGNLGRDEFEVLDNNVPRNIEAFSSERQPVTVALM